MTDSRNLWDPIFNQTEVKENLKKIFSSQSIPPSIIFTGKEGIGKEAIAFAFAQSLNCELQEFKPCGKCRGCLAVSRIEQPYIHFIFPLPTATNESPGDDPVTKLSEKSILEIETDLSKKKLIFIIN